MMRCLLDGLSQVNRLYFNLMFITIGIEGGNLLWKVSQQISDFGHELALFCPVKDCCSEHAGWTKYYNEFKNQPIFLNVINLKYNSTSKYDGRPGHGGFYLFIRNLEQEDLNIAYTCTYGFDKSPPKYLTAALVFRVTTLSTTTETGTIRLPTTNSNGTDLILIICVSVMGTLIIVLVVVVLKVTICREQKAPVQTATNASPGIDDIMSSHDLNMRKYSTIEFDPQSFRNDEDDYDQTNEKRPFRKSSSSTSFAKVDQNGLVFSQNTPKQREGVERSMKKNKTRDAGQFLPHSPLLRNEQTKSTVVAQSNLFRQNSNQEKHGMQMLRRSSSCGLPIHNTEPPDVTQFIYQQYGGSSSTYNSYASSLLSGSADVGSSC